MSSILPSSPFAAPPPSAGVPTETPSANAVTPLQATARNAETRDGSSFSGSGTGSGNSSQGDTVALMRSVGDPAFPRPSEATGGSVVNAQAQEAEETLSYGSELPEVEMPYPLPTSPFLLEEGATN